MLNRHQLFNRLEHSSNSPSSPGLLQWPACHVVIRSSRPRPCSSSKVTAEGRREHGVLYKRCLWARPGTYVTCAHIPLPRAKQWPCLDVKKAGEHCPGLAVTRQQSFYPGKGARLFGGHWPSLPQMIRGRRAVSLPVIRASLVVVFTFNLFHPLPTSLGSRW